MAARARANPLPRSGFRLELPPPHSRSTVFPIRAGRPDIGGAYRAMRATFVALLLLVSAIHGGTATAGECPPDALGVARTIVVDPREHPRIGALQYNETLPLNDKEVVLTFDDGPVRATQHRARTLASEVPATFFMVGQMANAYPPWCAAFTTRTHDREPQPTHPFTFSRMSVEQAAARIQADLPHAPRSAIPMRSRLFSHSRAAAAGLGRAIPGRARRHDLERDAVADTGYTSTPPRLHAGPSAGWRPGARVFSCCMISTRRPRLHFR